MAQIYGELIRAQLQLATSLSTASAVKGLIYFDEGESRVNIYDGAAWQKLVTKASIDDLSALPIITPAKGGLGADASAWTGFVKANAGVFSASAISTSDLPSGIDATKLADGSVSNTEFQKLNTVGTNAAGEIVNTDGTQTLTNKTLGTGCSFDASALPIVTPSKGGTGVANNDLSTITLSGDSPLFLNLTGSTSVFLPETGTLATTDGGESLTNKLIATTEFLTGALTLPVGTTGERPTGPAVIDGMVRYNIDLSSFEGRAAGGWAPIGGGGTTDRITQASHGFVVGDALYLNGSTYTKAIATSAAAAEVIGVVSRIIDASTFEITLSGEVSGLTGLTVGEVYFLSAETAGLLTTTEPTVVGQVSVPVGVASSATSLYVALKRGSVVGSSNARTQIALANNATTTVQNIAAYDAGELTGWVSITATTPLRFYVAAQFSKNGAANNFNVSYQVSGDTPPAGFVVTATAAGLLQVTLPSIAGFASASINYALNAPAIGTSFPLSVQSSSIVWSDTFSFRNKIINGNFDIWQRGTTQTVSDYGSADRWYNEHGGSSKTVSRQQFANGQTDVSGNPSFFMRTAVTSVAGAANYAATGQYVENVSSFSGQIVTLSFWAKADAAKNMAIEFIQNFGTGGTPSARVTGIGVNTVSLTTVWQKYSVTVSIPSISSKALGSDGNSSLQVIFWFDSGSNYNARTNSLGHQSGTFDLARVQLESGSLATPFEDRHLGVELPLCQRYYQRLSNTAYVPASCYDNENRCVGSWFLSTPMRATPTLQNVGTSTISYINSGGNAIAVGSIVATYPGTTAVSINCTVPGRTLGQSALLIPAAGAVVGISAEL
jgi:hypothetical protein